METTATEMTASTLKERLRERGLTQTDLARAAGMEQSTVSGVLNGYLRLGPLREKRLVSGILRLGLHKEAPKPAPKPEAEPVVIHLPAVGEQDGEQVSEQQ
jgi:transcriptional regulator with XRE-family HTH domain